MAQLWHLASTAEPSGRRSESASALNALGVPRAGRRQARLLFSSPGFRAVVVDLRRDERLGEHSVPERMLVHVLSGQVTIDVAGETLECEAGTLLTLDPGERHAVRCSDNARLLFELATSPVSAHTSAPSAARDLRPRDATSEPAQPTNTVPATDALVDAPQQHGVDAKPARPMNAGNGRKRILLVVDTTIRDARIVRPAVRVVTARQPSEVYVVAPILESRPSWITNDDGDAIEDAEQRLSATLRQLFDRDIDAHGAVADDDGILAAVGDALAEFPADEIIIAVHTEREQHWREKRIAAEIRSRHAQPLTELVVGADGVASVRS